jgi:hypothetical protein
MSRERGAPRSGDRSANAIGSPTARRFGAFGLAETIA